ncbi:MAG: aminoglycoside phosphotransferase family protein, partial [Verrucomicrobiae bacterium]|nr:aminoglycoside phosphotransferase family protein [Verrucomicrobiae bacterium]
CKIGHINETYTATYDQGGVSVRYIHQKINRGVFKDPAAVMENVVRVTTHLRKKLEEAGAQQITRRALTVVPARDGKSYYCDGNGDFWRTYVCVERVQSFESVQNPTQAYEAGRAFGEFQALLSDLPGERLHETIPHFHDARARFAALCRAIEKDSHDRARFAKKEIDFALQQESWIGTLLDAHARGEIPERITHNDTKFNNVMLDWETGKAVCVVDLDTVMPGLVHYDFGDMVRTTTSPTREDETDLNRVEMQMPMFKELARGYIEATRGFLTPAEKRYLAFSGRLITYVIGIRFLTDYLSGDTYFRVHRPHHNLDRCRTQFKLVQSIMAQEEEMQKFVDSL